MAIDFIQFVSVPYIPWIASLRSRFRFPSPLSPKLRGRQAAAITSIPSALPTPEIARPQAVAIAFIQFVSVHIVPWIASLRSRFRFFLSGSMLLTATSRTAPRSFDSCFPPTPEIARPSGRGNHLYSVRVHAYCPVDRVTPFAISIFLSGSMLLTAASRPLLAVSIFFIYFPEIARPSGRGNRFHSVRVRAYCPVDRVTSFAISIPVFRTQKIHLCRWIFYWRPQGDSNPRYRRERAMS